MPFIAQFRGIDYYIRSTIWQYCPRANNTETQIVLSDDTYVQESATHQCLFLVSGRDFTRFKRMTNAMILVSWIETFIFIRGVIIQIKPMK